MNSEQFLKDLADTFDAIESAEPCESHLTTLEETSATIEGEIKVRQKELEAFRKAATNIRTAPRDRNIAKDGHDQLKIYLGTLQSASIEAKRLAQEVQQSLQAHRRDKSREALEAQRNEIADDLRSDWDNAVNVLESLIKRMVELDRKIVQHNSDFADRVQVVERLVRDATYGASAAYGSQYSIPLTNFTAQRIDPSDPVEFAGLAT